MKENGKILFRKYEIIGHLGQGTEGNVYLAKDLHLSRLAAVKERRESMEKEPEDLSEGGGGSSAQEQEIQIEGEAKLLRELLHPGGNI